VISFPGLKWVADVFLGWSPLVPLSKELVQLFCLASFMPQDQRSIWGE